MAGTGGVGGLLLTDQARAQSRDAVDWEEVGAAYFFGGAGGRMLEPPRGGFASASGDMGSEG